MQKLGAFFARMAQRFLPDPMVLACALTLLVTGWAVVSPYDAVLREAQVSGRLSAVAAMWFEGVWNPGFLAFALQMCVVLLTGYGLAQAPPATRAIRFLASRVRSNRGAVTLVTAVSCVGCWLNWGFGLIAAGILAGRLRRELAARGVRCQFALIVAGAYAGMMIWHGGLSGSAPLKVAEEGVVVSADASDGSPGGRVALIPIGRTTLAPANLGLTAVLFVAVPWLLRRLASDDGEAPGREIRLSGEPASPAPPDALDDSPAERLNRSRVIAFAIAALALGALGQRLYAEQSHAVDLNFVNMLFLALGLALHGRLGAYVAAVAEGGRAVTGIVLQFPLYAGIQGVMQHAGIAAALSSAFIDAASGLASALDVSPGATFPIATFLSAGLVNLFVPSGGGQWIVQGPIVCAGAKALSLPVEQAVMAVAYGDQWTNMVQPFWAIPVMGLTGLDVRRFMGYCVLLMLLCAPIFAGALLLF